MDGLCVEKAVGCQAPALLLQTFGAVFAVWRPSAADRPLISSPAALAMQRFGAGYTIDFGDRPSWLVVAWVVSIISDSLLL